MRAIFWRDLTLAWRSNHHLFTGIIFFIALIILTPFSVGPAPQLLNKIAPGMLWAGVLLANLLSLDSLFQNDHEDGSLEQFILTPFSNLALLVFAKALAHWIALILPLIIIMPILALTLHLNLNVIISILIGLLCGTPAITFIGTLGAALSVSLPQGGMLIAILTLPLIIPVLIFGIATAHVNDQISNTALSFLLALSLFFAILGPTSSALALKYLT